MNKAGCLPSEESAYKKFTCEISLKSGQKLSFTMVLRHTL